MNHKPSRLLPALRSPGSAGAGIVDRYLPSAGSSGYRVSRYELELGYTMSSNRLAGRATLILTTTSATNVLVLDLADGLRAAKVSVNDERVTKFRQQRGKLTITLARTVPIGSALTLVIRYVGNPKPSNGPWGEVGWEELADGVLVASQPNGASSWFPCNDHPSNKASYRITIACDSPYQVIANGTLVSKRTSAGKTTWVYDQPEPMASYLATIAIGAYETKRLAEKPVPITAVYPSRLRRQVANDLGRQGQMMKSFSSWFGPYPFSEYTVVITDDELEIPIEAQTISTFGANHCDGHRGSERLVAHELAHQWFGNSVTLTRWTDIWLHEGFACYAEWLWSQESGGPSTAELVRKYYGALANAPQDLIVSDPGPADMFDDRVYKRGAITIHALRVELGDADFFALLHEWNETYRHSSATTDNFTSLAAKYADHPLRDMWHAWLLRPELPTAPPE